MTWQCLATVACASILLHIVADYIATCVQAEKQCGIPSPYTDLITNNKLTLLCICNDQLGVNDNTNYYEQ